MLGYLHRRIESIYQEQRLNAEKAPSVHSGVSSIIEFQDSESSAVAISRRPKTTVDDFIEHTISRAPFVH
jgi:hypothetical protein